MMMERYHSENYLEPRTLLYDMSAWLDAGCPDACSPPQPAHLQCTTPLPSPSLDQILCSGVSTCVCSCLLGAFSIAWWSSRRLRVSQTSKTQTRPVSESQLKIDAEPRRNRGLGPIGGKECRLGMFHHCRASVHTRAVSLRLCVLHERQL